MYRFYYDYLEPKYGDKCKLLFTDTDSVCCHIETEDLYADMAENIDHFDATILKRPIPSSPSKIIVFFDKI